MHLTSRSPQESPPPTRPHRTRVVLAAAGLLAALAILASACGGGGSNNASGSSSGGSSSKTTSAADSAQQSGIAYAQCMRAHGVTNYPDNAITTSGGATKVNLPSGITSNPDYKSASQACQSKLPKGANGGGASGGSSNVNAVIKFANCMRSHGVTNFPEPNSSGQEIISGSGGVDPNSPTYQSAMTACKSLLPNGGSGAAG